MQRDELGKIANYDEDLERCLENYVCDQQAGKCVLGGEKQCTGGQFLCNDACIDPESINNCGATDCENTGEACKEGLICTLDGCACPAGTIACDGNCIAPSVSTKFCGAKGECLASEKDRDSKDYGGEVCVDSQTCQNQVCKCPAGFMLCNKKCIDPYSNMTHCGAAFGGQCNSNDPVSTNFQGTPCPAGTHICQAGKCFRVACDAESEQLCPDPNATDGMFSCKNLKGSDVNNCGACGWNCTVLTLRNAQSTTCDSGKCKFTCVNSADCGKPTDLYPTCLSPNDLKYNPQHCGDCTTQCNEGQYCEVKDECTGEDCCRTGDCGDNSCPRADCFNRPDACGRSCTDCTTIPGVASGGATCGEGSELGKCIITKCSAGMHIAPNADACVMNTVESCGASDSSVAPSCLSNGVKEAYCNNHGKCVVTSCDVGLALYLDPDDSTKNRCYDKNCCKDAHALDGKCENGACNFSTCLPGYHQMKIDNVMECVKNSDNACAPANIQKTSNLPVNCYSLFYDEKDVLVTGRQLDSNNIECDNNFGVCKVKACPQGYHIETKKFSAVNMQTCVANSDTACAPVNSAQTEDCAKLETTTGTTHTCVNGACTKGSESCANGYREIDGRCISNCCAWKANVAVGKCDGTKCSVDRCKAGYHIGLSHNSNPRTCEQNTPDSCGAVDSSSKFDCYHKDFWGNTNVQAAACVDGQCIISACKEDYHIASDGKSCVQNSNTACGFANSSYTADCTKYKDPGVECSPNQFCETNISEDSVVFCNGVDVQCIGNAVNCYLNNGLYGCK